MNPADRRSVRREVGMTPEVDGLVVAEAKKLGRPVATVLANLVERWARRKRRAQE